LPRLNNWWNAEDLLSDDILTIDPIDIQHAKVDMTILDAKLIYERV
jgi:predicted amidohydrolase YtcJ